MIFGAEEQHDLHWRRLVELMRTVELCVCSRHNFVCCMCWFWMHLVVLWVVKLQKEILQEMVHELLLFLKGNILILFLTAIHLKWICSVLFSLITSISLIHFLKCSYPFVHGPTPISKSKCNTPANKPFKSRWTDQFCTPKITLLPKIIVYPLKQQHYIILSHYLNVFFLIGIRYPPTDPRWLTFI